MSLLITHQDSLFTEDVYSNDERKSVCYVVKTTPFCINLAISGASLDFNSASLKCTLHYDTSDNKLVDTVKSDPFEFTAFPSADGATCSVRFRVRCLSTQHGGSLFKICIRLFNRFCSLETWSLPIKSCSKLEQIRRREAEKEGIKVKVNKKRTRSDELLRTLDEIKTTQTNQTSIINSLMEQNALLVTLLSKQTVEPIKAEIPTLEKAIEQLIVAYRREVDDSSSKVELFSSLCDDQRRALSEIGFMVNSPVVNEPTSKCRKIYDEKEIMYVDESSNSTTEDSLIYTSCFNTPCPQTIDFGDQNHIIDSFLIPNDSTTSSYFFEGGFEMPQNELDSWSSFLNNFVHDEI